MDWVEAFEGPLQEHVEDATDGSVRIPWPEIETADRDLGQLLLRDPDDGIRAAESALSDLGVDDPSLRVWNPPEDRTYRVGKYGSDRLGELIGIHGRVVNVEAVKPFANVAVFECRNCKENHPMSQPGGKLVKPFGCENSECEANATWELLTDESEIVDFQEILLKRTDSSMKDPPVEAVYLWEDLCETISTGDVVTIAGIYDTLPWPNEAVLKTFVDAVSINKSEQPATVDEVADWRVKQWTFEAAERLCDEGSSYDAATADVVEAVSDKRGIAEGEIQAAISDLEDESHLSEHTDGRVHMTTTGTPEFGAED